MVGSPKKKKRKNVKVEVEQDFQYCINGVKIQFPVKAYPTQITLMSKIIQGLQRKQCCLLESPTGSGKSLALLCAALAWLQEEKAQSVKVIEKENEEQCVVETYDEKPTHNLPVEERISDEDFKDEKPRKDLEANEKEWKMEILKTHSEPTTSKNKGIPKIATIYFGTRTHKQITQIVRELQKTAYKDVRMSILGSREYTCIHPTVSKGKNKNEECKKLVQNLEGKTCRYYSNAHVLTRLPVQQQYNLDGAWDIEDLVAAGKKKKACPYYGTRELSKTAEIIFCPFNYLIDPVIRSQMSINLNESVVILDEAHNIEDVSREAASASVTMIEIEEAKADLQYLADSGVMKDTHTCLMMLCSGLLAWMESVKEQLVSRGFEHEEKVWTGDEVVKTFQCTPELHLSHASVKLYREQLTKVTSTEQQGGVNDIAELKVTSKTLNVLSNLMKVLEKLFTTSESSKTTSELKKATSEFNKATTDNNYSADYRAILSRMAVLTYKHVETRAGWRRKSQQQEKVWTYKLQWCCLNPAVTFSDLGEQTRCVILTSGTLSPMTSFASELGVKFPITYEANHVIQDSQVWVGTLSCGPSGNAINANYKSSESFSFQDDVGNAILQMCECVPRGVLCFLPSYSMMEKLHKRWKTTGLLEKLSTVKSVFLEPRGSDKSEFDNTLREYYGSVNNHNEGKTHQGEGANQHQGEGGGLLLAVCRGKASEGMDFSDDNARAVISIGIPFPNVKDTTVQLKRKYNNNYTARRGLCNGKDWYELQAFRALNQALGRCLRHRNDWGALLLIDERFSKSPKYVQNLSKWIRGRVKSYNRFQACLQSLSEFANKQHLTANDEPQLTDEPHLTNEPHLTADKPLNASKNEPNLTKEKPHITANDEVNVSLFDHQETISKPPDNVAKTPLESATKPTKPNLPNEAHRLSVQSHNRSEKQAEENNMQIKIQTKCAGQAEKAQFSKLQINSKKLCTSRIINKNVCSITEEGDFKGHFDDGLDSYMENLVSLNPASCAKNAPKSKLHLDKHAPTNQTKTYEANPLKTTEHLKEQRTSAKRKFSFRSTKNNTSLCSDNGEGRTSMRSAAVGRTSMCESKNLIVMTQSLDQQFVNNCDEFLDRSTVFSPDRSKVLIKSCTPLIKSSTPLPKTQNKFNSKFKYPGTDLRPLEKKADPSCGKGANIISNISSDFKNKSAKSLFTKKTTFERAADISGISLSPLAEARSPDLFAGNDLLPEDLISGNHLAETTLMNLQHTENEFWKNDDSLVKECKNESREGNHPDEINVLNTDKVENIYVKNEEINVGMKDSLVDGIAEELRASPDDDFDSPHINFKKCLKKSKSTKTKSKKKIQDIENKSETSTTKSSKLLAKESEKEKLEKSTFATKLDKSAENEEKRRENKFQNKEMMKTKLSPKINYDTKAKVSDKIEQRDKLKNNSMTVTLKKEQAELDLNQRDAITPQTNPDSKTNEINNASMNPRIKSDTSIGARVTKTDTIVETSVAKSEKSFATSVGKREKSFEMNVTKSEKSFETNITKSEKSFETSETKETFQTTHDVSPTTKRPRLSLGVRRSKRNTSSTSKKNLREPRKSTHLKTAWSPDFETLATADLEPKVRTFFCKKCNSSLTQPLTEDTFHDAQIMDKNAVLLPSQTYSKCVRVVDLNCQISEFSVNAHVQDDHVTIPLFCPKCPKNSKSLTPCGVHWINLLHGKSDEKLYLFKDMVDECG